MKNENKKDDLQVAIDITTRDLIQAIQNRNISLTAILETNLSELKTLQSLPPPCEVVDFLAWKAKRRLKS